MTRHSLLTLWCASAVLLLWATDSTCAEPTITRLTKVLGGGNEKLRMEAIAILRANPDKTQASLADISLAIKQDAERAIPKELVRPSFVELIDLLGSTASPEAEETLTELLKSNHTGISMVAADVLGRYKLIGAIKPMSRQIYRPEYQMSYGFRFNLIRAIASMKHPDAYEFLDTLRLKLDGQLRYEIEKLLKDVSELDFDGDRERWARWQQKREPKIRLVSEASESLDRDRMRLGQAQQYYGIDINAKRMMFIIDHSGSMQEMDGSITRLARAKRELIYAIAHLPKDAEFAILFFATRVHQWRDELMEATDENKREAISFVERLDPGMQTNTYAALRYSLEFDSDLEAVFLLTDGRPTTGDIIVPDAIVLDILHRNRFRHLQFNTIGIALDTHTEAFLRRLSHNSGGDFRRAK